MKIKIGQGGEFNRYGKATTVSNSDGETVSADGGKFGVSFAGGNGWSGGGGRYWGVGGQNGSDGKKGSYTQLGGRGQHMPLPTIPGVTILPGSGGKSCQGCYGGGGGGIIINGKGKRDNERAAQGFGAGGGKYADRGQHGAVILYL